MSNISMVEARLPPGFRFHPRDEELVCDYLMKKLTHTETLLLIEVDLNKCEPWDIPESASVGGKEWYFYSQRDRKYATGLRTNRATATGYWKATGKDRHVLRKGSLVGMRKTLVFYQGRAPKGRKTNWVMHEFRLQPPPSSPPKEDWVLCRVFYKNREVVGKGSYYEEPGCSSSSLPALLDSHIAFDQSQPNLLDDEQVPCFSFISSQHQKQNNNPIFTHIEPNIITKNMNINPTTSGSYSLDPSMISCEKKVIDAVLTQYFTNMETKASPSLGEASSESYLSEVAMPNIWNNNTY